jgi:hypothetical protein
MTNNEPINETPTARAIREAVERRLAMQTRGTLPAIVRRPAPRYRRTSVPHRAIR